MSRYSKKIKNALKSVGHNKVKKKQSKPKWTKRKQEQLERNRYRSEVLSGEQKQKQTQYELLLTEALVENQIMFESQKPIYHHKWYYVADFFIHTKSGKRLIVELDGKHHYTKAGYRHDTIRGQRLSGTYQIHTLRYSNRVAVKDINRIIADILAHDPVRVENICY